MNEEKILICILARNNDIVGPTAAYNEPRIDYKLPRISRVRGDRHCSTAESHHLGNWIRYEMNEQSYIGRLRDEEKKISTAYTENAVAIPQLFVFESIIEQIVAAPI